MHFFLRTALFFLGMTIFLSSCKEPDNKKFRDAIEDYYSVNNLVIPSDDLDVEILEVISIENKNEWDVFATVSNSKKYRYRIKKLDSRLQVVNVEETKAKLESSPGTEEKIPAGPANP